jgi:hypothetical protein|tara:strand:- start:1043 stop:1468 length:426 start_codon:yes stop_codon:yes gene_type:complete
MIDPEKLFSNFELPHDNKEDLFHELQKTQTFKLGMFKKIIWNQKNIEAKMGHFLEAMPELAEKIDFDNDAGEFVTHTRAWTYLKDYDPTSDTGRDAGRIFADQYTITACDLAISFWEEKESYEKCAHIKKVKDFLELNVIP